MVLAVSQKQDIKMFDLKESIEAAQFVPTFNYQLSAPADSSVSLNFWSENTKSLLYNLTQKIGISHYSPTVLKDDNTAIAKSQSHLIDMMKYYEGDRYHYYEAITTSYKDKFGTWTNGFGELSDKITTQEKAYKKMAEKLETYAKEVKNLLDKKIGRDTYDNLPASIKEALIDLDYNKGLGKISANKVLLNAIENKDYSKVVANLAYVYSGKTNAEKVEDAGLYKRSLSRAILAVRDLKGSERKEAQKEVENLYAKAKKCYKLNGSSTSELDKIYEQFTTGKISAAPVSAQSFKIDVDDKFKGKGVMAVAQEAYNTLVDKTQMSWNDFFAEFKRINRNPESVKIGEQMNVPCLNNVQSIEPQKSVKEKDMKTEKPVSEEKGFWGKLWDGVKGFFKAIGNFFVNLFSKKETNEGAAAEDANRTPFQKMLDTATIKQDGDFQIISQEYTIKKGDNLWNLSRLYGTSEEIICNDNGIVDKNKIREGQTIKIQKLGYKVLKGDNLFRIAQKFGLSVEILKDVNNIEDINAIEKDQMLEIPGFIYNVEPKDNLTQISRRVGVSVKDLVRLNGLTSGVIKPGQQIKVVYNNGFYSASDAQRNISIDETTNEVIETIDMSKYVGNRKYIQKAIIVNGKVVATREVFQPTKKGKLSGKNIIVNAGHGYKQGGIDEGTAGRGGLEAEWLINYDNAMRLKDRLCAQGAKVIFLQGRERGIPLISNEINKAENKADMFISIHVNAGDGKKEVAKDRMEIYHHRDFSPKLAETFEKEMDKFTGKPEYAQTKDAGHQVLKTAGRKKMPGLLWEVAFMDSKEGRKRLSSPKTMDQYSDVLCNSIIKYFENQK